MLSGTVASPSSHFGVTLEVSALSISFLSPNQLSCLLQRHARSNIWNCARVWRKASLSFIPRPVSALRSHLTFTHTAASSRYTSSKSSSIEATKSEALSALLQRATGSRRSSLVAPSNTCVVVPTLVNAHSRLKDILKVIVEDLEKEGGFDEAVRGVDAIEHTASPFHFNAQVTRHPQPSLGCSDNQTRYRTPTRISLTRPSMVP